MPWLSIIGLPQVTLCQRHSNFLATQACKPLTATPRVMWTYQMSSQVCLHAFCQSFLGPYLPPALLHKYDIVMVLSSSPWSLLTPGLPPGIRAWIPSSLRIPLVADMSFATASPDSVQGTGIGVLLWHHPHLTSFSSSPGNVYCWAGVIWLIT